MSSGTSIVGTYDGVFYKKRSWNGGDGKYSIGPNGKKKLNFHSYGVEHDYRFATRGGAPYNQVIIAQAIGSPWASLDSMKLQSKLVEAIRGHDFNLGVAVAEGKQTVNMAKDALLKIGTAFVALKRGNFALAARQFGTKTIPNSKLKPSDISGRWLELQFGWIPLLSDVKAAAEAYHKLSSPPKVDVIRVSHRSAVSKQTGSDQYKTWQAISLETRTITYRLTESLSDARSLGLLDPASVAWELVPYSFVVDWFLPIGNYLENLNALPFLTGEYHMTTKYESSGTAQGKPPYTIGASAQRYYSISNRGARTSGLQAATPSFKPLEKSLSPTHIWDAIALASQKMTLPRGFR